MLNVPVKLVDVIVQFDKFSLQIDQIGLADLEKLCDNLLVTGSQS